MFSYMNEYFLDLKTLGIGKQTAATYRSNLINFFMYAKVPPEDVKLETLSQFLYYLRFEKMVIIGKKKKVGCMNSTINGYFASINSYYDFLKFRGIINENVVPMFRQRYLKNITKLSCGPENSRQLISIEDMASLIYTCDSSLHRAVFMTYAKTGIRRNELITLDMENIDLDKGIIHLKPTAKRTFRTVFIDNECIEIINEYLEYRGDVKSPALFTHNGRRLTKNDVYNNVTLCAYRLGLHKPDGNLNAKFTPHCFRHWFTTTLHRASLCREHLQALRGDVIKEAVDIYTHIDPEELQAAYLKRMPKLKDHIVNRELQNKYRNS